MSWQFESPLWDLIDKNNKKIPHYDDIALVTTGYTPTTNVNQTFDNYLLPKGNFYFYVFAMILIYINQKYMILYFIDSPVSDRFISPAPGQSNVLRFGKQIATNESRPYFSVTSRNNGVLLPTVTGPLKKIGTLGLFFRKVSTCEV